MGSQHHDSRVRNSGNENAQIRAKILSVIDGIVSNRIKDGLVLDVPLRLKHGGVQWSNVQEVSLAKVGQDSNLKPRPVVTNNSKINPTLKPKPISVCRLKSSQHTTSHTLETLFCLAQI